MSQRNLIVCTTRYIILISLLLKKELFIDFVRMSSAKSVLYDEANLVTLQFFNISNSVRRGNILSPQFAHLIYGIKQIFTNVCV